MLKISKNKSSSKEFDQELESNDSYSTVSSSIAYEEILQQFKYYKNLSIKPREQATDSAMIKFEKTENVSIVYQNNFYSQASKQKLDKKCCKPQFNFNNLKKFWRSFKCGDFYRNKKLRLIFLISIIGVILAISCALIYYSFEKTRKL
jgi:hypothetical protein